MACGVVRYAWVLPFMITIRTKLLHKNYCWIGCCRLVCDKKVDVREEITINVYSVEISDREEKVIN